jgi:hypothetical protein
LRGLRVGVGVCPLCQVLENSIHITIKCFEMERTISGREVTGFKLKTGIKKTVGSNKVRPKKSRKMFT